VTHLACYAYGVGHGEEGVCLQLEIDHYRILLDCGLAPIGPDHARSDWPSDAIDLVICSHAHPDHARGLLCLHQHWPDIPIYASGVTAQLLPLNWPGQPVPSSFGQILPWRSPVELRDRLTVELLPAGHLPGAAAIVITYQPPTAQPPVRVVYSGDFCLSNTRLAEGLRLNELRGLMPDALIVAGTHGTQRRPPRRQQENHLMERLAQAIEAGQSVLLPLPTIGLGQELLYLLRSHYLFSGRALTIWVDGAVAKGCDAYLEFVNQFPIAVQNFARNQALFWDDQVQPHVRRGRPDPAATEPCIVLTDGRSDLSQCCHHGDWLVLLPETTMAMPPATIAPLPTTTTSQAIVTAETYWLSAHSDGNATLQLIHNLRPQHLLFVHGAPSTLAEFAQLDELSNRYKLHLPRSGSLVELPITDRPIGPTATVPETRYEGEVVETAAEILISLPPEFATDARWQGLADTGMVEAYWQDNQLIIRGLSPQDLAGSTPPRTELRRSCSNCQYYHGQRCSNAAAPLFQLQVTPDGYCLEYDDR
jgi:Cft2 family RNA processing exonuclease